MSITLDRAAVERAVRLAIEKRLSPSPTAATTPAAPATTGQSPKDASGAPKLVVNVSARHAHVTQEDLERLFGPGHQLKPIKWLYQDGFFAAEETVTIIGPRQRTISGIRILGPCRDHSQVELAFTEAMQLGLDIPVRKSGDHRDSPGAWIMGPKGMIQLKAGVIRHERHVHMGPSDCEYYGVKDGDRIHLRVKSTCSAVLEDLLVREGKGIKLEVHIDTDEGNAVDYPHATKFELFR